jgi:RNA polymerase sigma-70 factor (ECF subfamily)
MRREVGREGDPRDLYADCYSRLVGVVAVAAADRGTAEEVVQEAFLRLLPRWSQISRYDDPEAWVRKVAFRLLSNRRRRAQNKIRALVRTGSPPIGRPPSGDRVDVARALATLPLAQRQVIVLHHLLDLPLDEVATELGVAVGTVKSRLARGRAALEPLLREEANDHA